MTQLFENQSFERFFEDGRGAIYADLVFDRCRFRNCDVSITENPRLRTIVRNVRLIRCEYVETAGLSAAILEEICVDGLKTNGLLQTWATAFKHVTLAGKIGRIMCSLVARPALHGKAAPRIQRAFDESNAAYYATVDWALDISKAEFEECDIRGIPAHLIRRDAETQVVVTREKAMQGQWRELPWRTNDWDWNSWINEFLKDGDPDLVLVAPKRARDFKHLLGGLQRLREAGVAEPE